MKHHAHCGKCRCDHGKLYVGSEWMPHLQESIAKYIDCDCDCHGEFCPICETQHQRDGRRCRLRRSELRR